MTIENDLWEEQYLLLIPEHFTASQAEQARNLMIGQPELFMYRLMYLAGDATPGLLPALPSIEWQRRFNTLPLTAHRARVLLALARHDTPRLLGALEEFITNSRA